MKRRSFLAMLASFCAVLPLARAKADTAPVWNHSKGDPTPWPEHYTAPSTVRTYYPRGTILGIDHVSGGSDTWISDGSQMIPIEGEEGQRILMESAVNVRSDGTIRHRQHHWPR